MSTISASGPRFWEYIDTNGNTWQTLIEQYEYGYWIREAYKAPFQQLWHHFPVPEANKYESVAKAQQAVERIVARRTQRDHLNEGRTA